MIVEKYNVVSESSILAVVVSITVAMSGNFDDDVDEIIELFIKIHRYNKESEKQTVLK